MIFLAYLNKENKYFFTYKLTYEFKLFDIFRFI